MQSEYKAFCQLENRGDEEEGVSKSEERKLKSRANWTACFLRAPLTAQCGWLCLFLSPLSLTVPTSLALSDYLFPGEGERRREKRERKRLVSTVMADERERDRFCLVAHLSSFSLSFPPVPQSALSQAPIFSFSLSLILQNIPLFLLQIFSSPLLYSTSFSLLSLPKHPFIAFQSPPHPLSSLLTFVHVSRTQPHYTAESVRTSRRKAMDINMLLQKHLPGKLSRRFWSWIQECAPIQPREH